ncbi:DUF5672 family protein [Marinomonas posidonica]|uniref:DUF5672 domain-containing protein n=1 Tax=Marinomonas posidonica (strain CECT 7376 / NCIMB 14433 / IVIA-Po-181) TaxID=491952 RepID=F6CZ88_MARPP|nr:DUF5672 family protein [Marinomonas posidonica]AEF53544.1 hypothetical protein Mar181_0481 [Marinomonas posidonica IVIA-Po-181]
MRKISNVTLVSVATTEVEATVKAIEYSIKELCFERVLLLSHYDPNPGSNVYEHVKIKPFNNVAEWGRFVVFDLYKYIDTDYIILIHADGFIVNPSAWCDDFLEYDYIGAPWPLPKDKFSYRDYYGNIIRCGNSVSLRSKKMLSLPSELKLDWESAEDVLFHEDGFLCVKNRHILQSNGVEFAPLSLAVYFSREKTLPENKNIEPFLFHQWSGKNSKYPCFGGKKSIFYKLNRYLK